MIYLINVFQNKESVKKNNNIRNIRNMGMVFPNVIYPLNAKKIAIKMF